MKKLRWMKALIFGLFSVLVLTGCASQGGWTLTERDVFDKNGFQFYRVQVPIDETSDENLRISKQALGLNMQTPLTRLRVSASTFPGFRATAEQNSGKRMLWITGQRDIMRNPGVAFVMNEVLYGSPFLIPDHIPELKAGDIIEVYLTHSVQTKDQFGFRQNPSFPGEHAFIVAHFSCKFDDEECKNNLPRYRWQDRVGYRLLFEGEHVATKEGIRTFTYSDFYSKDRSVLIRELPPR